MSYGKETLEKLNNFFIGTDRANLTVAGDFWAWRKENPHRAQVLNAAGLSLNKTPLGWKADLTRVSAETLDEAVAQFRERQAEAPYRREKARVYLRSTSRRY